MATGLVEQVKRPLRGARGWPPLNRPATAVCRSAVRRAGQAPDALVRYLPRAGLVEAPLPRGDVLRLWSRADDDVTSAVYWRGWAGHEPETARLFYALAASARTTLDVGAHVGYFALLASYANPAGKVYAFEPLLRVYERLRRNVALNEARNVSCVRMALADGTGEEDFFHFERGLPSTSSLSRSFMETAVGDGRLVSSKVAVTSVDEFVEGLDVRGVDLVKIDTEGCESAVLRGMQRVVATERPSIICEVLSQSAGEAIERLLDSHRYDFFLLTALGPQRREHVTPHAQWRNFAFMPQERAPRTV